MARQCPDQRSCIFHSSTTADLPLHVLYAAASAQALVNYYLTGEGGTVFSVLETTMGVDVEASIAQANATLTDLQASGWAGVLGRLRTKRRQAGLV